MSFSRFSDVQNEIIILLTELESNHNGVRASDLKDYSIREVNDGIMELMNGGCIFVTKSDNDSDDETLIATSITPKFYEYLKEKGWFS